MTTLAVDEVFVLFFNYHLGTAKDVGPYFMAAVFCRGSELALAVSGKMYKRRFLGRGLNFLRFSAILCIFY